MKVKLSEIINSTGAIRGLMEEKLPVKVSYRLLRIVNKLQPELTAFESKRDEFIKEFGDEQEDGNIAVKDPKKLGEFTKKMVELLDLEIDVDIEKIKVEELGDIKIPANNLVQFILED